MTKKINNSKKKPGQPKGPKQDQIRIYTSDKKIINKLRGKKSYPNFINQIIQFFLNSN